MRFAFSASKRVVESDAGQPAGVESGGGNGPQDVAADEPAAGDVPPESRGNQRPCRRLIRRAQSQRVDADETGMRLTNVDQPAACVDAAAEELAHQRQTLR